MKQNTNKEWKPQKEIINTEEEDVMEDDYANKIRNNVKISGGQENRIEQDKEDENVETEKEVTKEVVRNRRNRRKIKRHVMINRQISDMIPR